MDQRKEDRRPGLEEDGLLSSAVANKLQRYGNEKDYNFKEQMDYLKEAGFTVVRLPDVVQE